MSNQLSEKSVIEKKFYENGSIHHSLCNLENTAVDDISAEYQKRIFSLSNKIAQFQMKKGQALTSPDKSREAIRELLQMKQEEVIAVIFLDTKHRIISFEELFH